MKDIITCPTCGGNLEKPAGTGDDYVCDTCGHRLTDDGIHIRPVRLTLHTDPNPTPQELSQDDRLVSCLLVVADMDKKPADRKHQRHLAQMALSLLREADIIT